MPGTIGERPSNSWVVLAALFFGRMCMGLQVQSVAALTPFLVTGLGLSYSEIGLLIGLFLLPGIFLGLPETLLGARFGYRWVGVTGVVLMAGGSAVLGAADGFASATLGRLVSGAGGILVNITFIRLVGELFDGRAVTRALSVLMCSWPIGLAVAALALPWIAAQTGWRTPFFALSLVCVLAAVFVLVVTPKRQPGPTTTATLHWWPRLSARDWALSLLSGASWAAFTAAGIIYLSFAPIQLVERGYSVTAAGAVVSSVLWFGLVGLPLGGWLGDKKHGAQAVILGGSGAALVAVLMVLMGGDPLLWGALLGIAWCMPAAPYMAMLQHALAPDARAGGYGVYFTLFYSGFFAFPALAGWLMDMSGTSVAPLYFAAILMAVTLPALIAFYRIAAAPGYVARQQTRGNYGK